MPVLNPAALLDNRVEAIRKYHADTGIKRATLDVSGGIDSAVMAGLLVLALGPENCTFDHTVIHSNPVQTERAKRLVKAIGGKLAVADFTCIYNDIVDELRLSLAEAGYDEDEIIRRMNSDPTIEGSIRSTLRAPLGRAYNRLTGGGIRHGTGNECEDRFLRFYQKGGDGEVDTNPLAMLSKAEVYQLAYELAMHFGASQWSSEVMAAYFETIGCIPSADLWANGDAHNDEDEISKWLGAKFTYGKLDCTTGKVVSIGTIERVARFLDEPMQPVQVSGIKLGAATWEELLFGAAEPDWSLLVRTAMFSAAFRPYAEGERMDREGIDALEALLRGARKAERCTRHKMNPNIPNLGSRKELIAAGILTDDFAAYDIKG